jgi:polyribonucleotide nucleotidyltransferase
MTNEFKLKIGNKDIVISTGKLAKQADGAVTVQCGGTYVLVTCVCSKTPREGLGFFPLTVEYREKTYAAGKIPGGFFKREGRPTEKEILTSRMIDRPIRPLFLDNMLNEVQVIATVLSSDGENNPDILAIIGASAALMISDIPFDGPIGAARVGLVDNEFIINPTYQEDDKSKLDMVVVANDSSVIMLEAGASVIEENIALDAIKTGHEALKPVLEAQKQMREKLGKAKREDISYVQIADNICDKVSKEYGEKIKEIVELTDKTIRIEKFDALKKEITAKLDSEDIPEGAIDISSDVSYAISSIEKDFVRTMILEQKKRPDGRAVDEIRELSSEVKVLPSTHGCGLFTRGQTQALAVVTLGTSSDQQRIESLRGEGVKDFMLHYNFPPFSVGETRPMRGPGRREIGHGALAEKALKPVFPDPENFPYTIRVVSEILESNGSSSMATVCAGSLALMDAGVPVSDAVAGIAMGVIIGGEEYTILTDIAGAEDHNGDMDFKVAGTSKGITAIQMDLKVKGISYDVLKEAFERSKKARLNILDNMKSAIPSPREDIASNAPQIMTVMVPTDKIKDVIGPGGKMIRKIIAETGADINIEDDGSCQIASNNRDSLDKAVQWVKDITADPEIGKTYDGRVTKIMQFGAFCEILPGKEGLIHVSEIADEYVKNVSDHLKEGDRVKVKVLDVDDQGKVRLSMKQAGEDQTEQEA